MADAKITALTALSGAGSTADTDQLVVVDVSDTTMAASGTDKKISVADAAAAVYERPVTEYTTTTPAVPASGVKIFTRSRAGKRRLAQVGPSGLDYPFQAGLDVNAVAWYRPAGNSTTITANGFPAPTAFGTATAFNWANTNLSTSMKGISYISAATASSSGGMKSNVLQYWRGNAAGLGGFYFCCRFAVTAQPANWRLLVGMYGSTTAPGTTVDPSTLLNFIGVIKDSADTNLQFAHNDGTSTATKSSTGLGIPSTSQVVEVRIFCAPNSSTINISCEILNGGGGPVDYSYSSTDIPANTQGLLPMLWVNNGGTASAVNPILYGMYVETDF